MKYLIDTQIVIWSLISPEKLSKNTTAILKNDLIFVSQICLFEIAIKQKIGKLPEFNLPMEVLIKRLYEDNFQVLSLSNTHIEAYGKVPLIDNHKDPFDRLLMATAIAENIPIISSDENFKLYSEMLNLIVN